MHRAQDHRGINEPAKTANDDGEKRPGGRPPRVTDHMRERGLPCSQRVLPAHGVGPVQRRHGCLTAANCLGVMTERHGRVGMARKLGNKADLDALGL